MAYDRDETTSWAGRLDAELRYADPLTILNSAVAAFGDRLALVSSFGAESAVLLHMVSRVKPDMPILFLDTGLLFAQTLDYRRALAGRLGLSAVQDLRPAFTDLAVTDPTAKLWQTDTDRCCHIRKVLPLDRALAGYGAWITGRKRFHGGDRISLPVVEGLDHQIKFNPLANWGKAELDGYMADYQLPAHPLVAQGFPSIGCWPCTQAVQGDEDVRAGRWAGSEKPSVASISRARRGLSSMSAATSRDANLTCVSRLKPASWVGLIYLKVAFCPLRQIRLKA